MFYHCLLPILCTIQNNYQQVPAETREKTGAQVVSQITNYNKSGDVMCKKFQYLDLNAKKEITDTADSIEELLFVNDANVRHRSIKEVWILHKILKVSKSVKYGSIYEHTRNILLATIRSYLMVIRKKTIPTKNK